MIYKQEEKIGFYDIDANGNIKLTALLKYINEAAWTNAEDLGASMETTIHSGVTFIIQRFGLRIFKTPKLNQKVTVQTWPAAMTRIAFKRNGSMLDEDGNKLMEWESLWVLLDINERKIRRPNAFPIEFPLYGQMGVTVESDKIAPFEEKEQLASYNHIVQFSELDLNMHMSNAIYADLIANVLSLKPTPNIQGWKDVYFNYVNEAKLNDEITVDYYREQSNANEKTHSETNKQTHSETNELYVSGANGEKVIFNALIKYEE